LTILSYQKDIEPFKKLKDPANCSFWLGFRHWSGKEILKMKKVFTLGLTAIMLFMMVGCMAGPNTLANTPDKQGRIGGLGLGIWHGFIAPVTFVVSLFNKDVQMYDVHNNGNQYNIGFILGLVLFFSIGTGGIFSRRWRR
jgi:hypothetical protein